MAASLGQGSVEAPGVLEIWEGTASLQLQNSR